MAQWRQIITSGSSAVLADLQLDSPLTVPYGGTGRTSVTNNNFLVGNGTGALNLVGSNGTGNVVRTDGATITNVVGSGSFSGSFEGDGSGLTGINVGAVAAPGSDTQVIFNDGGSFAADAGFTYNSTSDTITVNGTTLSDSIDASSTVTVGDLTTGTNGNSVIIDGGSGVLKSRTIDSKVWGSNLIDGTGANDRIAIWNGTDGLTSDAGFTYNGTLLDVDGGLTISGSTILGDVSGDSVTMNAATINLPNIGTGTDNTILIQTAGGDIATRDPDSRIWGSSLVDGSGASTRVAYWSDNDTLTSDTGFTFDGTDLTIGTSTFGNSVDVGSTMTVGDLTTGTNSNNVIIDGGSGVLRSRTIDSKVWGSNLVDGTGATNRVTFWSDSDTISSDAQMTYDSTGNVLTVDGSTFGEDVEVAGNLTVLGDTITAQVTNLEVEDRFVLLNSGSSTGDGGLIIQNGVGFSGVALGWDDSENRFGVQLDSSLGANATAIAPDSYLALAVSGSTTSTSQDQLGNIRVDGGEIYIYG